MNSLLSYTHRAHHAVRFIEDKASNILPLTKWTLCMKDRMTSRPDQRLPRDIVSPSRTLVFLASF